MRSWKTPEEIAFLSKAVSVLQNEGLLSPQSLGAPSPLDLSGLVFPTVSQFNMTDLPTAMVHRIAGSKEYKNAILQDIDLTSARLNFSVWINCAFERVCFNLADLRQVRFFGCQIINCIFRSADLRDASFTVGPNGAETEIINTLFESSDFRGASCNNPVIRSTSFVNCNLEGFVFDGALCDNVGFTGTFKELTFRGIPNDGERNRIRINLYHAALIWLNVDHGIDLHQAILPSDESCLVVKNRIYAVDRLCSRLPKEAGKYGILVANVLKGLFSDRSISALEPSQDMILISKSMIADFAETDSTEVVGLIFNLVRSIAESDGFLV